MSHDPEINELEHLLDTDPKEAGYAAAAERSAAILEGIAGTLRDPQQRDPLGGTTLPVSVTRAVSPSTAVPHGSTKPYHDLVTQAARVAANLAADCDINRTRLAEAGYPSAALKFLTSSPTLHISVLRPVVASLMNLVVERHAESVKAISSREDLATVVSLASAVYIPGDWEQNEGAGVASWLWTIADAIVPIDGAPEHSLSALDVSAIIPTLAAFGPRPKPANADDDSSAASTDLTILAHATAILDRFNAADKIDHAGVMADRTTLAALFGFVEEAVLPSWVTFKDEEDEDEDEEPTEPGKEQEKTLGVAKAAVARTIVSLLAETQAPDWVWGRVSGWLDLQERPDLVACALLSYGNKARSDASATQLLPTVLPHILPLMKSSTPMLVQHALIGLLRNLSIPEANKKPLGDADVIEKLVAMDPWAESRDVLGSVQGGAVGVIKNLVREASNATRFLITTGPAALHALIKRTNDPAIAMEGCRVWVNAIRSLARTKREGDDKQAWDTLRDSQVITDLCGMISRGEKYIVLVNEGVLALALLVSFGERATEVDAALAADPNANANDGAKGEKARSAAAVLASVLAPTPSMPVGSEVQANALTLVTILGDGKVKAYVREQIAKAREEGRSVAAGVEVLDA